MGQVIASKSHKNTAQGLINKCALFSGIHSRAKLLQLALYPYISDVTVVTSIRNVPGSKWRLLSNVLARRQNWQNGGKLEQFKAKDRLISRCEVRQCSQMQPGVRVREKRRSRCYPIFTFSYYFFLTIFPTEFLHTSSA